MVKISGILLSTKNRRTDCDVVLKEDGNIVSVQNQVCKLFNKYYVSAATAIGQPDTISDGCTLDEVLEKHKVHPSVKYIGDELRMESTFELQLVNEQTVRSKLLKINVKKATGWDNIPPKILKSYHI